MDASAADTKPPYGGFRTFWNFIEQLSEDGNVPQRLDRSVMGSRGGSSRAELYIALRFFRLMTEEKAPTTALHETAADPTPQKLRELVERSYAPVITLGLKDATPRMVDEALSKLGATPSTVQRSRTFFLNAAEEAGIPLGKTLKNNRAPTTAPRKRPKRTPKPKGPAEEKPAAKDGKDGLPDLIVAMIEKMPTEEEGWDDQEALRRFLNIWSVNVAYAYGFDPEQVTGS